MWGALPAAAGQPPLGALPGAQRAGLPLHPPPGPRSPRSPTLTIPPAGLDCSSHSTAPIWVAGAERVTLASVSVQRAGPWRADWRRAAAIDPYSTRAVVLKDVVVT